MNPPTPEFVPPQKQSNTRPMLVVRFASVPPPIRGPSPQSAPQTSASRSASGGPSPTAQRLSVVSRVIWSLAVVGLMEKTARGRLGKRKSAFSAFPQPRLRLASPKDLPFPERFGSVLLLVSASSRLWLWRSGARAAYEPVRCERPWAAYPRLVAAVGRR